jgi:hypothetical protein
MADFRALATVCEAVIQILRSNYDPADFDGSELEFRVYLAGNFSDQNNAINQGVSLFLYRVLHNGDHRKPQGRLRPDGERDKPQLPLDMHFLLTAWGQTASMQHTVAGWMMRVMEDNPILPSALLNAVRGGVFHPDETIEIGFAELSNEDLLRIWEGLVQHTFHLSVPYVARNVRIDSFLTQTSGEPVQTRVFEMAKAK